MHGDPEVKKKVLYNHAMPLELRLPLSVPKTGMLHALI
jgi:hypothetical protein